MRVIKGSLKGRNILVPPDTRPVSRHIRKACFDILGEEVKGAKVLDLFAGSGALGIEAFSAGAASVVFVDNSVKSIEAVRKNVACLPPPAFQVYRADAFRSVAGFAARRCIFDFIFLDPPYYKGMLIKALQALEEYDILAAAGYLVCFSCGKDEVLTESVKFAPILDRKYGQSRFLIYRKNE